MNILDFALEKEQMSLDFYNQLAQKTSGKGLHNIFVLLVAEEQKHYDAIKNLKEKVPAGLAQTDILNNAIMTFGDIRDSIDNFDFDISELDLYKKAVEVEGKALNFYLEKVDQVEGQSQKDIFRVLAMEEKKHYTLIDNIVDFVSRPKDWLENAEFTHLEEY